MNPWVYAALRFPAKPGLRSLGNLCHCLVAVLCLEDGRPGHEQACACRSDQPCGLFRDAAIDLDQRMCAMGFGKEYIRLPLTPMEEGNRAKLLAEMRRLGVQV